MFLVIVYRFKPALVRRNLAMIMFSMSMVLTCNHFILAFQVWARGSPFKVAVVTMWLGDRAEMLKPHGCNNLALF